jgi:hypothetical protein
MRGEVSSNPPNSCVGNFPPRMRSSGIATINSGLHVMVCRSSIVNLRADRRTTSPLFSATTCSVVNCTHYEVLNAASGVDRAATQRKSSRVLFSGDTGPYRTANGSGAKADALQTFVVTSRPSLEQPQSLVNYARSIDRVRNSSSALSISECGPPLGKHFPMRPVSRTHNARPVLWNLPAQYVVHIVE